MDVLGTRVKGAAVFFVLGSKAGPLARVSYGQYLAAHEGWVFPAYYPYGLTAAADLRSLGSCTWDARAREYLTEMDASRRSWEAAVAAWETLDEDPLPAIPASFFPPGFLPYRYQRYGIAQITTWERLWLQWDMGTGKTRTVLDALRILRTQGKMRKALVLGPPVVLPGWEAQTALVTRGEWRAVIWDGTDEAATLAQGADVVLATYTRAHRACVRTIPHPTEGSITVSDPETSPLLGLDYDVIVADESHNLGNPESLQTQAAYALAAAAIRRIALTGTPGDDPVKIYSQLRFLSPAFVPPTLRAFCDKYYRYRDNDRRIVVGYQNLAELNAHVDAVASRMKKRDVLPDLPPRRQIISLFSLGLRQQARYNEMVAEMRVSAAPVFDYITQPELDGKGRTRLSLLRSETSTAPEAPPPPSPLFALPHAAARVTKLLQLVSGFLIEAPDTTVCDACPKLEACVAEDIKPYTKRCEVFPKKLPRKVIRDVENPKLELFTHILEGVLSADPTNKVVCWGIFDQELDDMMGAAKALGTSPVRLDGSTTKNVGAIEAQFREDPTCRVLIGIVSAGIGINLQVANNTIFYSRSWLPLHNDQADERINRPGQTRAMTTYILLTAPKHGAVDRMLDASLRFKAQVGYTMVERIACVACDRMTACTDSGTVPFSPTCRYAGEVTKTSAKVTLV